MDSEISREELRELAESPIGGPEARAAAAAYRPERDHKPPKVLKETAKRAAKIWLPRGRKGRKVETPDPAVQIDLEDAVEAAGGRRGSIAA